MKRKGFTLIELLAVIVVLAVIALITTPLVLGVIEKSRTGALQDSGYGLVEAGTLYYAQYQNENTARFDIENNRITTEEEHTLTYKGSIKEGTVLINNSGEVTVCINDGARAAYKNYKDTKVTVVDKKTCTIPENKSNVYLDGESTITEMTNSELTAAIEKLTERVNQLESDKENLEEKIVKLETDKANQDKSISDLEALVENQKTTISSLSSQLSNTNNTLSALKSKIDSTIMVGSVSDFTVLQAGRSTNKARIHLNADGSIRVYTSTDNGETWVSQRAL